MAGNGYYPLGAEYCDNAPWNLPDYEEIYGEDAKLIARTEVERLDDEFVEWLIEKDYVNPESTPDDYVLLSQNEEIIEEYLEYRFETLIQQLKNN